MITSLLPKFRDFYFRIDLRSLGLFRILFGGVLIYDWCSRWPDLEAFYTSFGFLPLEAPLPRAGGIYHFSLLDGVTSLPMVQVFFGLGLVCYLCFLLGYRVRLFHFLSFIFLISVQNRNTLIRHGGDFVLVSMLLWSLFLPLGKRFSLDYIIASLRTGVAWNRGQDASQQSSNNAQLCRSSLAAFVIVFQIALIYFFSGFDKSGEVWKDGTALYWALQLDQFATPMGKWLGSQPMWLIKVMTWITLGLEFAVVPLILLPFAQPFLRRIAIAGLLSLHFLIWLTMTLGSFPFVMVSTYALLLLPADWALLRRLSLRLSRPVVCYYDNTCGFCAQCCRLVALADQAHNIRFIGATDKKLLEHEIPPAELDSTIVVFDVTGRKLTKAAAFAAMFRALPLPFHLLRPIAWPGIRIISDRIYEFIAGHRHRLSAWMGLAQCGIAPSQQQPTATVAPHGDASPLVLTPIGRCWYGATRVLENGVVLLIFISCLIATYNSNIATDLKKDEIREPALVSAVLGSMQLVHDWHLFAPYPMTSDGWWVIDGVTESGAHFDPLTGTEPTWEKPDDLSTRFSSFWRKYLYRLYFRRHRQYRLYYGKYLTRQNHREKPVGERLVRFKIYYVLETTQPPGTPLPFPTEKKKIWGHECF